MKLNSIARAALVSCALTLAACGGGGDEGSQSPNGSLPDGTEPAAPTVPTVPTVPTGPSKPYEPLAYTPVAAIAGVDDVEEVAAFNKLNNERTTCGFKPLQWNDKLAAMARGHADWLLVNNYRGHYQAVLNKQGEKTQGFTGVYPEDRAVTAGYVTKTDTNYDLEDLIAGRTGSSLETKMGVNFVKNLLIAPYHALGMLGDYAEAGFAVRNATDTGSTHGARVVLQVNLGTRDASAWKAAAAAQEPWRSDADTVRTYPCQGVTGTQYQLTGENPNPTPGRDLAAKPIGQPVMIVAKESSVLLITSASMTPVAAVAAVPPAGPVALLPTLTSSTDTHKILEKNEAVLMPDLPLLPNTGYAVVINGTVNGQAFTRSFTFTTGDEER